MLRSLLITAGLVLLIGCRTTPSTPPPEPAQPKFQSVPPASPASPKVAINETYDKEIKGVIDLASHDRWEEAQIASSALRAHDPTNAMLQRLHDWVVQQGQKRREQALENKIREVEAKNSVFNPTPLGLLTEKKDRGLPATKDVRDTVNRIENTPYIPETYGKTIRQQGPLFDIDIAKGPTAKVLEKEVSIHVDNVPLENIIVNLSQTVGVNIIADKSLPALKQTLIVNWEKVRLGEFFRYLGRNYDLQFQVGPDFVWVVDAKGKTNLVEETRFYRLRKGFVLPAQLGAEEVTRQAVTIATGTTVTESQKFKKFVNDDAPLIPALEKAITNFFTGSKWMIDYERNQVLARGTPEQLEVLENIIRAFDQPIQQVLIEARFVTLSKPAFLQLGALWETGRTAPAQGAPQDLTGLINGQNFPSVNNVPALGIGLQETFTNVFGRDTLRATITALEQTGESQTLSAPRLTVLNNRPASISDGKVQYYYEEYQVKQTVQQYYTFSSFVPAGKPTKITSGAELNVLASISGDGKHILLALNPRVNTDVQLVPFITVTDDQGTNHFVISLPQYRTQELATRVVVKSGETVAMGGVLAREKSTFVEAVPVLGSIPIIGALFRRRTEVDKPRYLLVFVTATILTDSGEFLIYDEPPARK
jgi:type IV pilus assembly protein PilQ